VSRRVKRVIDVALAVSGLVMLAPVMLAVAVALRLNMGSPVLFRHTRPGYLGRPFVLVKFRTMRPRSNPDWPPDPNENRITRLGYFLRRTSLDEIPELWNVLKGDMSIVGPRPLMMEYLPLYTPEQARRHEVRPGMTGLAQIRGRHLLEWEERFKLDVWYVDHWSLRLDAAIMRATIAYVLRGSGLPAHGSPEYVFHGSAPPDDGDSAADQP
jgi:lipopolysaccharide/colanic/teichoic acid biosynthesis glycosyltransferase